MTASQPVLLAPMEGLLDWRLREVLTQVPGIDRCVSEFIRITDQLLPPRVFMRVMPELQRGSRTLSGVPVRAQLLGSDPVCIADNAARLAELGAEGVDLNFGCPAKTVNRHRGGAVLLDEPDLLHAIVAAVRQTVPAALPVSAKMRLGNRDAGRMREAAQAIATGGAGELVVHGRTRVQGYRPPAYWDQIGLVREAVPGLPVYANGELWTPADAARCRRESGCHGLMLGRGQVADPGLALALKQPDAQPLGWADVLPLIGRYAALVSDEVAPRHQAGRLKQWLNLLRRRHAPAQAAFEAVRAIDRPAELMQALWTGPAVSV